MKEFQFQAETKRLLDLMIHSLYTNKEIFLRELISNASDAIDRLRFEALTNPALLEASSEGADGAYEIRLEPDKERRTLTISDNGIGMSQEEVIAHIGTIAKSGTRELRERIKGAQGQQQIDELIGQFGVGFYSSFMVADKVTLLTRRAGENGATLWESSGDGVYTITEAERPGRGTSITLYLKPADPENGIEDYTDPWVLSGIVRRHSDFVSYPIVCKFEREEVERDEEGKPVKDAKPTTVVEDKTLNSMKPIWSRPQSEIKEEEYADFYRHISHDWNAPLKTISLRAEGKIEYQALLFIPAKAPFDLFYQGGEIGLRLYAKRVMIMERCEDLLPSYLRFVKGVVDSADLPLNISRQTLQQDRHITLIRKGLTKKVLDTLQELKEKEYDKYLQFWEQFGRTLKEGAGSDFENKDRIVPLLLFQSSNDPEKLTTLGEYVERMKEGQNEIYYLTGDSRSVVENSPHLEALKEKGYESLFLLEPIDELLMPNLMEFQGKRLKAVGKGEIDLNSGEEKERIQKDLKQKEEESSGLLEALQKALQDRVKEVRLSSRLVSSPACLVGSETDYSPQLERLLRKETGAAPKQRRTLELNPNHELFVKLRDRFGKNQEDGAVATYAELMFGYALLAEGAELPDPAKFNRQLVDVMLKTL
jgi:molecular chaperone HtpG